MTETLLEKLKKLQLERSDVSPFSSHLDFLKWSDLVYPLLSFEPNLQFLFKKRIDTAKSLKAMDSSPDIQINEAIGILNQAVYSLEIMPTPSQNVSENKLSPSKSIKWAKEIGERVLIAAIVGVLGYIVVHILGISL